MIAGKGIREKTRKNMLDGLTKRLKVGRETHALDETTNTGVFTDLTSIIVWAKNIPVLYR